MKNFFIAASILFTTVLLADMTDVFAIRMSTDVAAVYDENISGFKVTSNDPDFLLPQTASQKILSEKKEKDTAIVCIQTGKNGLHESSPEELKRNLDDTAMLTYTLPEIAKISQSIKKEKDPLRAASLFVNHHISRPMIGIPLARAKTILDNRAGDCTEYSVLCVSILRGAGIPARAVMGVILTPPQKTSDVFPKDTWSFIYHMWCEAYFNGQWQVVDATRPLDIHENRYIAFTYHSLKTENPMSYLEAISRIKELKIMYLNGKDSTIPCFYLNYFLKRIFT